MENRRHHLIILGSYQRRIIVTAVMTSILLINVGLIGWFLFDPSLLSHIDTIDTIAIAGVELAVIGLIFVLSLFASNKIAGPIYAFNKVLHQIRDGDLSARLHLRPGDICHSVADEMNETFDDLESRITALRESLNRLQETGSHDDAQQALISELQSQLEHFTNHSAKDK